VDHQDYGNGVRSAFGYDDRGFTNLTNTYLVSPVQTYTSRTYWRDDRDRITAWVKSNNTVNNPLENGRGDRYTYDAFGQPAITDWFGNYSYGYYGHCFMFQGREYIRQLGIYDYRHRFYHPGLGRFLQTDPTGFGAGDMNLFRYCDDDPVDRTDPMGLWSQWSNFMLWQGGGDGTVTEQLSRMQIQQQATAAMDKWAGWARANKKEVAGTVNSKEEAIDGPESGRTSLSSDPGVTKDTAATWHLHLVGMPGAVRGGEYQFSHNLYGSSDSNLLRDYPNIPHYVGVLDGPSGKFTIFGYLSKDQPFVYLRPNYGVTPGF
jgi:RHS repeat-associated protein